MPNLQFPTQTNNTFRFGHLGLIILVAAALFGVSWMKNPAVFSFKKISAPAASADAPRYYAYETPQEYQSAGMVAGASTQAGGPSIINEDGSITQVDMGQVLGASTENVQLPLEQIAVNEIPDSGEAVKQYFSNSQNVESGYINNADFEAALTSGSQAQVNSQAQKLTDIKNNLQSLPVPHSLVKLQKLKVAQYQAGIGILNNFTRADENPQLVGQYLDQFLKSQQELDAENQIVMQKYSAGN